MNRCTITAMTTAWLLISSMGRFAEGGQGVDAAPQCPVQASNELKQEILAAIRARSKGVKSFLFEWKEVSSPADEQLVERLREQAIEANRPEFAARAMERARMVVAMHQGGEYRLLVDGDRMRFDQSKGEPTLENPDQLVPQILLATFDGKITTSAIPKSAGSYPRGYIRQGNQTRGIEFVGSLPIIVALRGAEWVAPYNVTAMSSELDGRRVVRLDLHDPHGRGYAVWCDPEKDYHAVRIERHSDSRVRSRYEISYERDEQSRAWVPEKWEMRFFDRDGAATRSRTSQVTKYAIGEPIPAEDFEVSFPEGTYVSDDVAGEIYIVLKNGEHRIVTPAEQEAGLSYNELMKPFSE